jgi:glutamate synthase (ferredoxin)
MQTIVYKGMLRSSALATYYKDFDDEDYVTAFAIYHRRFSTNTNPKWPLAQPMRVLGHNGEINTLQVCLHSAPARHCCSERLCAFAQGVLHPLARSVWHALFAMRSL